MAAKTTKAKAAADKAAPAADQADDIQSSAGTEGAGTAPAVGAASESTSSAGDGGGESGGDPETDPNAGTDGAAGDGGPTDPADDGAGESSDDDAGESLGDDDSEAGDATESNESTVSGDSVNAQTHESANAQTGERATDQDEASELETAQTPAENEPASPVILGAWSLPAIRKFPATLTLTNHTASRFVVLGKGVPVDGSIQMEVTKQQFSKLAKSLRGSVQLDKWDNVRGLQVAYDPQN